MRRGCLESRKVRQSAPSASFPHQRLGPQKPIETPVLRKNLSVGLEPGVALKDLEETASTVRILKTAANHLGI